MMKEITDLKESNWANEAKFLAKEEEYKQRLSEKDEQISQ